MPTRELFEKTIISKTDIPNLEGYVSEASVNLLGCINKELFYDDLLQGSGNEMKSKFNALYSSCALAVNNFAIVKEHLADFKFLDFSDFKKANFERQLRTGLSGTPPNLDFAIESDEILVAFESKYLEPLRKTRAEFTDSYSKCKLNYLDDRWFNLIEEYKGDERYLDVAQLIKHSIGLINYKRHSNKQVMLVYIYWLPDNFNRFPEYTEHAKELNDFSNKVSNCPDLNFIHLSYNQFWDSYNNTPIFKEHFDFVKKRYKMEI